jgi:hypothetical protein
MLDWFSEKVFGISTKEAFSLIEKVKPGEEYRYFPRARAWASWITNISWPTMWARLVIRPF